MEKSVSLFNAYTFIIAFNRLFRSQTALWRKVGVFLFNGNSFIGWDHHLSV